MLCQRALRKDKAEVVVVLRLDRKNSLVGVTRVTAASTRGTSSTVAFSTTIAGWLFDTLDIANLQNSKCPSTPPWKEGSSFTPACKHTRPPAFGTGQPNVPPQRYIHTPSVNPATQPRHSAGCSIVNRSCTLHAAGGMLD